MRRIILDSAIDFEGWRNAARQALAEGVAPADIAFSDEPDADSLFDNAPVASQPLNASATVPRAFVDLAQQACLHSEPSRYDLLYRLLWRLQSTHDLMALASDPDVAALHQLVKTVRRDIHKMHAFVRFRHCATSGLYIAWYEPDHHCVEAAAPFFHRRFATMNFAILTPERSVLHQEGVLHFGPAVPRDLAPKDDELEPLWLRYYSSIFNPARTRTAAMQAEMPKHFWKNLPEAALIPSLVRDAATRTKDMIDQLPLEPVSRAGAAKPDPSRPRAMGDLANVAAEAAQCQRCPLWEPATQTVFGAGPSKSAIMLVGEQPGDQEDVAGTPFVGPAGQLLDRALAAAGLDRDALYVTNAVKHFKFLPRGKRRIHQKPVLTEIRACLPWLEQEMALVSPRLVVMLGATAGQAVVGRSVTISRERGRIIALANNRSGIITMHPSALLRLPPDQDFDAAFAALVADLRLAGEFLVDDAKSGE